MSDLSRKRPHDELEEGQQPSVSDQNALDKKDEPPTKKQRPSVILLEQEKQKAREVGELIGEEIALEFEKYSDEDLSKESSTTSAPFEAEKPNNEVESGAQASEITQKEDATGVDKKNDDRPEGASNENVEVVDDIIEIDEASSIGEDDSKNIIPQDADIEIKNVRNVLSTAVNEEADNNDSEVKESNEGEEIPSNAEEVEVIQMQPVDNGDVAEDATKEPTIEEPNDDDIVEQVEEPVGTPSGGVTVEDISEKEPKNEFKDQPKDESKDEPKEESKDESNDEPKDDSKDEFKDEPKDEAKDEAKDTSSEEIVEDIKETKVETKKESNDEPEELTVAEVEPEVVQDTQKDESIMGSTPGTGDLLPRTSVDVEEPEKSIAQPLESSKDVDKTTEDASSRTTEESTEPGVLNEAKDGQSETEENKEQTEQNEQNESNEVSDETKSPASNGFTGKVFGSGTSFAQPTGNVFGSGFKFSTPTGNVFGSETTSPTFSAFTSTTNTSIFGSNISFSAFGNGAGSTGNIWAQKRSDDNENESNDEEEGDDNPEKEQAITESTFGLTKEQLEERKAMLSSGVVVPTGEESEESVFNAKAKLYALDLSDATSGWKERGIGPIHINKATNEDQKVKSRIVMRADGVFRVILNLPIIDKTEVFQGMPSSGASEKFTRITGVEEGKLFQYAIKCGNQELAQNLYDTIKSLIPK